MRRKIKKLLRDFKVPVTGTLIFLLCLCGLLFIRHQERVAVVGLAKDNPLINSGKSRLISKDQALALTQNNQTAVAESTKQTTSTSSSSSSQTPRTSQGSSSSGGGTSPGGGTTTPPDTGGGSLPPTPPPSEPFSVDIIKLDYNRAMGSSPTSGGNTSSCTVMHQFTGIIRGNNGPGAFTYHWEQMNGQRSPDFNENAGPGESYFQVLHSWPISSPYGVDYDVWVKLVITAPSFEQRQINFEHYC